VTAAEQELVEDLVAAGVDQPLSERLAAYGGLLLEANRRVNLTGAKTAEALVEHLLDALTLRELVVGPLVDVGSGGGLPGIPLALATGVPVLLLEPVQKKARFLEGAIAALGIDGAVAAERAEAAAREERYRERFATATARAVAAAPTVAELTLPFLRIDGRALLQRGTLGPGERQAVADAAPMLGAELVEERPLGGERRILVLVKRVPTPLRFPRRTGIPEKRPLCAEDR
jgi:16S rRNA (guanine527-N7)-methyltransferase